jgi:integrase
MAQLPRPRGRPARYAKYAELEASLPKVMTKRPTYLDRIGLFRGQKAFTVWVKIRLTRGGEYKGRSYKPGESVEIKLGERASWQWDELERERDRLQGLADRGEPLVAKIPSSFADYADAWLARKKATVKGYGTLKGHVEKHLRPAFGRKSLDTISVGDLNNWIAGQRATLKPATVQRQMATLNAILNDAVRAGELDRNPSSRADRIRDIEGRERFVTDSEWQSIIATTEKIENDKAERAELLPFEKRGWLRDFVMWAYHSGMRRAEALNLTYASVRELEPGYSVVEVTGTKSGKTRFVTCTPEMLDIIERSRKVERTKGDERIFPVSLTTAKRNLTKLWRATGLDDVRLHDLRRTHATKLILSGIDVRTVAGRLGHTGSAMLAKHYAVDRGDKQAAEVFYAANCDGAAK